MIGYLTKVIILLFMSVIMVLIIMPIISIMILIDKKCSNQDIVDLWQDYFILVRDTLRYEL